MYKGIRKDRENLKDIKMSKSPSQQLTACNSLVMMRGVVSWRGGSQEVVKPTTITQIKMEDVCILCNVIEIFYEQK